MAKVADASTKHNRNTDLFVDSPSGRKIQYRLVGRCGDDDPVAVFFNGICPLGMPPSWQIFANGRVVPKGQPKVKPQDYCDCLPWTIVVPERGGYGKSTLNKATKDWTYDDAVTDTIAVMNAVCGSSGKFASISGSSGCMNSLHLAYSHPERCVALFLNSADANYGPGFPKGKKHNEAHADGAPITYVDGSAPLRPGSCMNYCCCYNPCCCCCCCCPKGMSSDLGVEVKLQPYKYADIKCPTFLVSGTKDDTVDPNCARYMASQLPNATLQIVEGMGHGTMPADVWDEKMAALHDIMTGKATAPKQNGM